jgi:hypothetical protein
MKAAICYLTWNRFEYTKKSIQSIINNTNSYDYELIWWDNGSTEAGMLDWIKNICIENKFKYLFFKRNEGLTRAMNNQMKFMNESGTFDVFCHIANDIVVPLNWLNGVFEAINTKKVGVVGLKMNAEFDTMLEKVNINGIELEKINPEGNVGGMHFCIPKFIYDILGGFKHVGFGYGQQDANYSLQVKLLPMDVWDYYLPLDKFKGDDLSFSWPIYEKYENARITRLRKSASDPDAGRNYREKLRSIRKQYDNGKISSEQLINSLKCHTFLNIDMSKLLESNFL